MPIVTGIIEIILTFFEYLKAKIALPLTKCSTEAQKIAMDAETPPAHQIGFINTNEMTEEEYEDEDL